MEEAVRRDRMNASQETPNENINPRSSPSIGLYGFQVGPMSRWRDVFVETRYAVLVEKMAVGEGRKRSSVLEEVCGGMGEGRK